MLKAGDRVKRIITSNSDGVNWVSVGDTGTVIEDETRSSNLVKVKYDKYPNRPQDNLVYYLEKIDNEKKYGMLKTAMQPEKYIKSGTYHTRNDLHTMDIISSGKEYSGSTTAAVVVNKGQIKNWSAKSARDAAKFFNELADALEEVDNG